MRRQRLALVTATVAAFFVSGMPAAAALPYHAVDAFACDGKGLHPPSERSWAQERLKFTEAWPYTQGQDITVAIVDSGVDNTHTQLNSRVTQSVDLTGSGTGDCVGHGTMVAGIIVAEDQRDQRVSFAGVAPQADLISIKQTNTSSDDPNGTEVLAQGIVEAVRRGAEVINVSITTQNPTDSLKAAVQFAQQKDVVVVAAAGNEDDNKNPNAPSYPASYPDVISVAAIDQSGKVAGFSSKQTPVSVAAPGKDILSTSVFGGYKVDDGTSFASPYVAGVAVLVRSYNRALTYKQVKERIEATADPLTEPQTGKGMVNPVQAVTAILPDEDENAGGKRAEPQAIPPLAKPVEPNHHTRNVALAIAASGAGLSVFLLVGAAVIPRGRRRGWRPGQRPPPVAEGDTA